MSDYASAKKTGFDEIPVVDITGIGGDADTVTCIGRELVETARRVGFFYIINHQVDPAARSAAFEASKRFFTSPQSVKESISVNQNQRGWLGEGLTRLEGSATHDSKEVFFWGWEIDNNDPDYLAEVPLVAPNQWPDTQAPWLKDAITDYYMQVVDLGHNLMRAIAVGLGADPEFFAGRYHKPLARGQLVYYPPASEEDFADARFGAAAHTDFGALTILAQDDNGGLQVLNQDGDWIEAPPIENTFVCNIGDLLQIWTGGTLISTRHRVINRSGKERFSIPIFFDPTSTTMIDPADLGFPRVESPITAGEHISGRNRKNFKHYAKSSSNLT